MMVSWRRWATGEFYLFQEIRYTKIIERYKVRHLLSKEKKKQDILFGPIFSALVVFIFRRILAVDIIW